MYYCDVCGAGDCCERTDLVGEPVLCDNCYALGLYDIINFGNANFNDYIVLDEFWIDYKEEKKLNKIVKALKVFYKRRKEAWLRKCIEKYGL